MITEIAPDAKVSALQAALSTGTVNGNVDFASSLVQQYNAKGSLSAKQWYWVEKLAQPKAAKAVTYAPGATVAFNEATPPRAKLPSVIIAIGETKQDGRLRLSKSGKGYLKIQIRAHGAWQYIGMITDGDEVKFSGGLLISKTPASAVVAAIEEFAENVPGSLVKVGKIFGICANCGTPLQHPVSVHMGIGPVCIKRFPSLLGAWKATEAAYAAGTL